MKLEPMNQCLWVKGKGYLACRTCHTQVANETDAEQAKKSCPHRLSSVLGVMPEIGKPIVPEPRDEERELDTTKDLERLLEELNGDENDDDEHP